MAAGGKDPANKTSRAGGFGASLLNKLSATARRKRKRGVDKTRRQSERKAISSEL